MSKKPFRVSLELANGNLVKVPGVNKAQVHDGVLSLYSMHSERQLSPKEVAAYKGLVDPEVLRKYVHLGSWPLVNLIMYRIHEVDQ